MTIGGATSAQRMANEICNFVKLVVLRLEVHFNLVKGTELAKKVIYNYFRFIIMKIGRLFYLLPFASFFKVRERRQKKNKNQQSSKTALDQLIAARV